jgi:hypothetical protein
LKPFPWGYHERSRRRLARRFPSRQARCNPFILFLIIDKVYRVRDDCVGTSQAEHRQATNVEPLPGGMARCTIQSGDVRSGMRLTATRFSDVILGAQACWVAKKKKIRARSR